MFALQSRRIAVRVHQLTTPRTGQQLDLTALARPGDDPADRADDRTRPVGPEQANTTHHLGANDCTSRTNPGEQSDQERLRHENHRCRYRTTSSVSSVSAPIRLSALFLRTLRDDPADAEVPSHKLLVRAGYIRRWAPGVYSLLPLGQMVQDNVESIVKDEMNGIGAQQVTFPALLPRDPYETTGRWTEYGDTLFRLKDRRGNDYLLGPTHEELFTLAVKDMYTSYRDFPVILYQVQSKYRDEARPRSGILRGREFLMKDSYSFDLTDEGLAHAYQLHRDAYQRTFTRLGIDYRIVQAISGAMGGSASEEFLAPSPVGEDTFVSCTACDYAANVEAVERSLGTLTTVDPSSHSTMQTLHTPNSPGITALVAHLNDNYHRGVDATMLLKNILFKADGQPIMVLVPGDREVDETKLETAIAPAKLEPFTDEDFAAHPSFVKGYVSAIGMAAHGVTVFADPVVAPNTVWVTGANKYEHHVVDAVVGRDFTVDQTISVATIIAGDPCPRCHSPLTTGRAIEIGHIFQLGRKYADAFALDASGPDGQQIRITMGSYGIGISRAVAVIAEQRHDDRGLCWPNTIAPAQVHIVAVTGKEGGAQLTEAERIASALTERGVRVILDDRIGVSAGIKFGDADLLGMPTICIVGKGLANGTVEVKDRRSGDRREVSVEAIVDELVTASNA